MQQRSAAEISRAELAASASGAVVVEIYDQVYQLRGTDPQYIDRLAGMVDDKMRAVSAHGATVDSLRVAVLAALNIADELERMKARYEAVSNQLTAQQAQLATQQAQVAQQAQNAFRSRAGSLAGMLDDVLMERKAS